MKRHTFFAALAALTLSACAPKQEQEAKPQLPILSWHSILPEELSLERILEMKEAGINVNFSHIYSLEDAKLALDLCQQAGIKSMFMASALENNTDSTVRAVMNHPGLFGYFLRDEPSEDAFAAIAEWNAKICAADSLHPTYLNLLPSYAWPEEEGLPRFREHVRKFIAAVPMAFYSFDYYPVVEEEQVVNGDTTTITYVRPSFYENLEIFSEETRAVGKPFWAFSLATAHKPYPVATKAHMSLQMYSNLAYGAQGLQYFTYWNPGTEVWDFNHAPITRAGLRSGVYERMRELNQELQARAFVFVGCIVDGVYHTGETIPNGTKRLEKLPKPITKLSTQGEGAVVSFLSNGDKHYAVVINRSLEKDLTLNIEFACPEVKRVRKDGSLVKASLYEPEYWLGPGEAEIFGW